MVSDKVLVSITFPFCNVFTVAENVPGHAFLGITNGIGGIGTDTPGFSVNDGVVNCSGLKVLQEAGPEIMTCTLIVSETLVHLLETPVVTITIPGGVMVNGLTVGGVM